MPHPTFEHQWEEDSYWKHYYQHLESEASWKEAAERDEYHAKLKKDKAKAAAEAKLKAAEAKLKAAQPDADGWQIVGKKGK